MISHYSYFFFFSSRTGENLVKLDLMDLAQVESFVKENRPDFVVHAAAQRFPDKVDADPDAAKKLNVQATETLAKSIGEYNYLNPMPFSIKRQLRPFCMNCNVSAPRQFQSLKCSFVSLK